MSRVAATLVLPLAADRQKPVIDLDLQVRFIDAGNIHAYANLIMLLADFDIGIPRQKIWHDVRQTRDGCPAPHLLPQPVHLARDATHQSKRVFTRALERRTRSLPPLACKASPAGCERMRSRRYRVGARDSDVLRLQSALERLQC